MKTLKLTTMIATLLAAGGSVNADTLQDYAAQCDAAIGESVPDFNCENGTLVPTTNHLNGKCDRPNVLNGACDPGSRFQVLKRTTAVEIVAHCRKQGGVQNFYKDIAVIQRNKVNGATCFYQNTVTSMDGTKMTAPSKGQNGIWSSPAVTAPMAGGCGSCHDNGGIVRSPYLAQINSGPNALPGSTIAERSTFNNNEPYRLIGTDFAPWKHFKVEVSGTSCSSCHRMGTHLISGAPTDLGTSKLFGPIATASSQESKNPHSSASPIWMLPNQQLYDPAVEQEALRIKACAMRVTEVPLPNADSCRITAISTGSSTSPLPPLLPPIGSSYEQASRINSAYKGLFGRLPTDGEYLRALKYLLNGQPGLASLIYPPNDIVLTGASGWTTVPFLSGQGNNTFATFNNDAGSFGAWSATAGVKRLVGDFNRDGRADIALTGVDGWGSIPIAHSKGDGSFSITNAVVTNFPTWAAQPGVKTLVGDYNGDGGADIALLGGAGWTTVPVAFSNKDGTFRVTNVGSTSFAGWARNSMAQLFVGDFNRDGRDDLGLYLSTNSGIQMNLSKADGSFLTKNVTVGAAFRDAASSASSKILTGDFDGSGTTDFVAIGGSGDTIVTAYAASDATFNVKTSAASGFPALARETGATVLVGDFDRNGRNDLAVIGAANRTTLPVAFSNGDGTFNVTNNTVDRIPALASQFSSAARLIGDYNHDGRTDIALVGGGGWTDVQIAVSAGNGTFTAVTAPVGAFGSLASTPGAARYSAHVR